MVSAAGPVFTSPHRTCGGFESISRNYGEVTSPSYLNLVSDLFNAALNLVRGFLEAECWVAISTIGLEPSVGFLYDVNGYQTKQPLVYDLEESFRRRIDFSVIQAFESKTLELHDFYFAGND